MDEFSTEQLREIDQNNTNQQVIYSHGDELIDSGDFEKAKKWFETAFRSHPSNANILCGIIECEAYHRGAINVQNRLPGGVASAIKTIDLRACEISSSAPTLIQLGKIQLLWGKSHHGASFISRGVLKGRDSITRTLLKRFSQRLFRFIPHIDAETAIVQRFVALCESIMEADRSSLPEPTEYLHKYTSLPIPEIVPPIVIVAGGCDQRLGDLLLPYRKILQASFRNFSGTIISGGTLHGISGYVGDLLGKSIAKIGYVPQGIAENHLHSLHPAYTIITSAGNYYSIIEPVQYWIDLLTSGLALSDISLLGIDGGIISQFEYQLALLVGIRTGIVRDSARAAQYILNDIDWGALPNLVSLDSCPASVCEFVQHSCP